jgi:hypothetical protein
MDNTTAFLLGILVTLACSLIAFILSSCQLSKQVKRLVKLINLILRGIEESGAAKFRRDEKGEPIGMIFDLAITESLHLGNSINSNEMPATKSKE